MTKQRKIVSMACALILVISSTALIIGCPQRNDGGNKGAKDAIKGILGVTPTGDVVDSIKGTKWEPDLPSLPDPTMFRGKTPVVVFAQNENIVSIKVFSLEIDVATYKIDGKTVIFDFSTIFDVCKNMTVDKLIEMGKKVLPTAIKDVKAAIEKEQDTEIKTELEYALKDMQEALAKLQNPTQKLKEELKPVIEEIQNTAKELTEYKQIKGILNSDNSELAFDISDGGKVILKKRK